MCGMTTNSLCLKPLGSYSLHPRKGWIVGPCGRGSMALKSKSSVHSGCGAPSWGHFRDAVRLPLTHPFSLATWHPGSVKNTDAWPLSWLTDTVSQKGNQTGSMAQIYTRETWERDALAGYKSPKNPLPQRNVISHNANLNSGASHGRLWKNSGQQQKQIKWGQNEWRKDTFLAVKHGGPEATPDPRNP